MSRAGYVFVKRMSKQRKARFVGLRLSGMNAEWAAFWAAIDRRRSPANVFTDEQIDNRATEIHATVQRIWASRPCAMLDEVTKARLLKELM